MDATDAMAALVEHGMMLEAARGPLPSVAQLVAGEPIRGSWWGHPDSHTIYDVLNTVADSPDVVRTRLVNGRVTLIHRRLWPALARVGDQLPAERVAALHEEHTASGAHRVREQPFPEWVPAAEHQAGQRLTVDEAWAELPTCVRPRTAR